MYQQAALQEVFAMDIPLFYLPERQLRHSEVCMRRLMKFLHEIGSLGFAGGVLAYMAMIAFSPQLGPTTEYVDYRAAIAFLTRWVILPSMLLVLLSGLLAMVAHYPFTNQGWVWAKALSGLLIFEASLASVDAPAQRAALAAAAALNGEIAITELADKVNDHSGALWMLTALAVANVAIAVWRPRFIRPSS